MILLKDFSVNFSFSFSVAVSTTQGTRKICLFSQPLCGIALCVVETAIEKLNEKLTEKSFSRITILLEPVYKNQMEK